MKVLGIDPGASGAVALLDNDRLIWAHDMPVVRMLVGKTHKNRLSPGMLAQIIGSATDVDRAYVEEVSAMPKQGVSSTFSFGTSYGMALGVLAALRVPYTLIRPPEWRRLAGVRGDKSASRHRATELFPDQARLFLRKKDDGRAEAALIAFAGTMKGHNG